MSRQNFNIDVVVKYYKDGTMLPLYIIWNNQVRYKIDKITQIKNGASLKYGLQGLRYTCQIQNQMRHLFFDGKQWFISPID
ncbi:MAG: hypothetical protein GXY98_04625 [Erysipelothrix sp.]|nr:hypothetical protein [Erysipelothrix sp.]